MLLLFLKGATPCVYSTIYNCFFTMWFCVTRFYFKHVTYSEHVSYLYVSEEKTKQLLKI